MQIVICLCTVTWMWVYVCKCVSSLILMLELPQLLAASPFICAATLFAGSLAICHGKFWHWHFGLYIWSYRDSRLCLHFVFTFTFILSHLPMAAGSELFDTLQNLCKIWLRILALSILELHKYYIEL